MVMEHGGPDGGPDILWDFSTNANAVGAPAFVEQALRAVDRHRYPDPAYAALRAALGGFHAVDPACILPSAGNAEAIRRATLAAHMAGLREVLVPSPGYAEYHAAARALGLAVHTYADGLQLLDALATLPSSPLVWVCEPCNPTGGSLPAEVFRQLAQRCAQGRAVVAVDRAYEPLRLSGADPIAPDQAGWFWHLWSPNKALGVTGVRAGWMVRPVRADGPLPLDVQALAPSWVLSAEGVGLCHLWAEPRTQHWLGQARQALQGWHALLRDGLAARGWTCLPSVAPFLLARPPSGGEGAAPALCGQARRRGLKLRDAGSLGLPGWVRLNALPPEGQALLWSLLGDARAAPTRGVA